MSSSENLLYRYLFSVKSVKTLIENHSIYHRLVHATGKPIILDPSERILFLQLYTYVYFNLIQLNEVDVLIKMLNSTDKTDEKIAVILIKNKEKEFQKLSKKGLVENNFNTFINDYYDKIYKPSFDKYINDHYEKTRKSLQV
jgi:predicted transcriptional regulator